MLIILRGNDNSFLKSLLKPEIKYICKFDLKEIIHKYTYHKISTTIFATISPIDFMHK